jgi:hypothetical protein
MTIFIAFEPCTAVHFCQSIVQSNPEYRYFFLRHSAAAIQQLNSQDRKHFISILMSVPARVLETIPGETLSYFSQFLSENQLLQLLFEISKSALQPLRADLNLKS